MLPSFPLLYLYPSALLLSLLYPLLSPPLVTTLLCGAHRGVNLEGHTKSSFPRLQVTALLLMTAG